MGEDLHRDQDSRQAELPCLVTCSFHLDALVAPGPQLGLPHTVSDLSLEPNLGHKGLRLKSIVDVLVLGGDPKNLTSWGPGR